MGVGLLHCIRSPYLCCPRAESTEGNSGRPCHLGKQNKKMLALVNKTI